MYKYPRCINLDWLECYVLEPITLPHDIDYWHSQGFSVEDRGYGTRIYNEMFTLMDNEGWPFIEIRRYPKSAKAKGETSVLPINATHIRFVNRYCYFENAGDLMQQFMNRYNYQFVSISRVDICLDFERFDSGDDPQKFIKRYIGHKYAKINQSEASTHFDDKWSSRDFNSFSWGSKKSDVGTKFYNKTKELYDEKLGAFRKPYILQSWFAAGLIQDPVHCLKVNKRGETYRPDIWRLEFSIKSNVRGWFTYRIGGDGKEIRSVRNTLETYRHRSLLLPIFDILQQHYFHFKRYVQGKSKYECEDKLLFEFGSGETFYRVDHPSSDRKPNPLILRLHKMLQEYKLSQYMPDVVTAIDKIIDELERADMLRFMGTSVTASEYEAMRRVIALRLAHEVDPMKAVRAIQDLLHDKAIY